MFGKVFRFLYDREFWRIWLRIWWKNSIRPSTIAFRALFVRESRLARPAIYLTFSVKSYSLTNSLDLLINLWVWAFCHPFSISFRFFKSTVPYSGLWIGKKVEISDLFPVESINGINVFVSDYIFELNTEEF